MKSATSILYLTHNVTQENSAEAVSARRRKEVLEQLGYQVIWIGEQRSVVRTFLTLLKTISMCHAIMIRIDGSGSLDKYSTMKLLFPRKLVIWEIHGYPSESLSDHPTMRDWLRVGKQAVTRRLYSYCSSMHIFISDTLKTYSRGKIAVKPGFIIENFVTNTDVAVSKIALKTSVIPVRDAKHWFTVFWGGNPKYPWHATGLLDSVAKKIQKRDSHIRFICVGGDTTTTFKNRNILYLPKTDRTTFLSAIGQADLCVALYRTPMCVPSYFSPMKLLDYLLMNKPIIISDIPSVRSHFKHNPAGVLTDNSISHLVDTIIKLKHNPAHKRYLKQNGKQLIAHEYSEKIASEKYGNFLKSCVSN